MYNINNTHTHAHYGHLYARLKLDESGIHLWHSTLHVIPWEKNKSFQMMEVFIL